MRRGSQIPVVILTARDDVDTLVTGLDLGASDFIAKPFRFDELLARIRTRLRETGEIGSTRYQLGRLVVDRAARPCRAGRSVVN